MRDDLTRGKGAHQLISKLQLTLHLFAEHKKQLLLFDQHRQCFIG